MWHRHWAYPIEGDLHVPGRLADRNPIAAIVGHQRIGHRKRARAPRPEHKTVAGVIADNAVGDGQGTGRY